MVGVSVFLSKYLKKDFIIDKVGEEAWEMVEELWLALSQDLLESESVAIMDAFLEEQGHQNDITGKRLHHEIYMSDARKVAPEKWKTVIRHPIKKK